MGKWDDLLAQNFIATIPGWVRVRDTAKALQPALAAEPETCPCTAALAARPVVL